MKRLVLLSFIVLLIGCSAKATVDDRDDFTIHGNIDEILAFDSLTTMWDIEDYLLFDEEFDEDALYRYTDTYLLDEDEYDSLTDEEQSIVKLTSGIVSKFLRDTYKNDIDKFNDDKEQFHKTLETGS